jgi:hypothetical protein
MWVKFCELLGPNAPQNKQCLELAKMAQIAVDFAKHGKCVKEEHFKKLGNLMKTLEK